MIKSKAGQRAVGLLVFLGCGYGIYHVWQTAMTEGYFVKMPAIMLPALAMIGLGMVFFPIDLDELKAKHGVDWPKTFSHYPTIWHVLFFVSIAAGLVNWYLLAHS